jgi:hypothetical protein
MRVRIPSPKRYDRLGVLVLGMGRSGTSAVTRIVNLLGVPLSLDRDMLPADDTNRSGFWESMTLITVNDALLRLVGGTWSCPPPPTADLWSAATVRAHLREARDIFDQVHRTTQWVCKDPRTCLTLPFWLEAFRPMPMVVVLVLRSPLEIVRSFQQRDSMPPAYSLALWERYFHHLLPALTGLPVFVARYEEVLEDPTGWMTRIRSFLDTHGVRTTKPDASAVADFVDPGLRHSAHDRRDFESNRVRSREQLELAQILDRLPETSDAFESPSLPAETRTSVSHWAVQARRHANNSPALPRPGATLAEVIATTPWTLPGELVFGSPRRGERIR